MLPFSALSKTEAPDTRRRMSRPETGFAITPTATVRGTPESMALRLLRRAGERSRRSMIAALRVQIVGAGLMGSQIGCEYALGGHYVHFSSRQPTNGEKRGRDALRTV